MFSFFKSVGKNKHAYTIAFYNLENLFDIIDDPNTLDNDFTPKGKKNWTLKRYKKKIKKLGSVITQIGTEKSYHSPVLIGVVEVENEVVLNDLINSQSLKKEHYGVVHYDSPDERGIDVALLYKKEMFELLYSKSFPLYLENDNGERDYTRDILLVKGKLNGELIHVLVNHWPSRRTGNQETEDKRIKAAQLATHIVDIINEEAANAKIIIMGDFNDDPSSKSVKIHLVNNKFYNPMERLISKGGGSLKHNNTWHLFDQIIFSRNFFEEDPKKHSFMCAEVFDKHFLKEWHGKYKGNPYRSYVGTKYQGGYSDHFPVYIYLKQH